MMVSSPDSPAPADSYVVQPDDLLAWAALGALHRLSADTGLRVVVHDVRRVRRTVRRLRRDPQVIAIMEEAGAVALRALHRRRR